MRFASRCKEVRSKSFGGAAVFFSLVRETHTAVSASQAPFSASAYVADYLLIGNSSDGYQFVFVELEAPNGRITKEKGTRFGEVINKGIEQVRDWQMYIAANWNVIVAELEKHSFSNTKLPRQLYKYCPYQIYYAVIAGLRKDFENIRDRKLQLQNENNITLLHYENLIDVANEN